MKKKVQLRDKEFDPFIDDEKKKTKDLSIKEEDNKKSNIFKFTKFDSIDLLLLVILIALLILVIILGFKLKETKENYKEYVRASIVVPVLSKDTNNNISVDVSNMQKDATKSYVFKVANNKDNNINPEEVVYALQLTNTDNVEVEVYKNDGKENILPGSKIILDNKLIANEEQVDVYTLKIKANNKTSDKELITINIVS